MFVKREVILLTFCLGIWSYGNMVGAEPKTKASTGTGAAASASASASGSGNSSSSSSSKISSSSAKAQQNKVLDVKIKSTCFGCIRRIERDLRQTNGVVEVKMTLKEAPHYHVEYNSKLVTEKDLLELLDKEGYAVEKIDSTGKK